MVATIVTQAMFSGSRCQNGHGTLTIVTVTKAMVAENLERASEVLKVATGIRRPVASGEARNHRANRQVGCYLPKQHVTEDGRSTAQSSTCERGSE